MTSLTLTTTNVILTLTPATGPALVLSAQASPQLVLQTSGVQGVPGPIPDPGPGFVIVGTELRFAISNLPRG